MQRMCKYLSTGRYFFRLIIISTTVFILFFNSAAFSKTVSAKIEQMPVSFIIESFQRALDNVDDYQCIFEEYTALGKQEERRTFRYFFKKPRLIRMEILSGRDRGSIAVYKDGRVKGRKGGLLSFITLNLKLTDPRVTNIRGDRIDESDWFFLLQEVLVCQKKDTVRLVKTDYLDGKMVYLLEFGINQQRNLYIEANTFLPKRLEQFDTNGRLIHIIEYKDIRINQKLTEDFFNL
jgi:outer membrane lipoprotein-sorting protein